MRVSLACIHTWIKYSKPTNFLDSKQTNFLIMNDVMGLSFHLILTAFYLLDCLHRQEEQLLSCESESKASRKKRKNK